MYSNFEDAQACIRGFYTFVEQYKAYQQEYPWLHDDYIPYVYIDCTQILVEDFTWESKYSYVQLFMKIAANIADVYGPIEELQTFFPENMYDGWVQQTNRGWRKAFRLYLEIVDKALADRDLK